MQQDLNKPKVSAIIPNYNYAQYVGEAIDSVLDQTYPNIEVVVVDDGSSDGSREILEGYGDRIKVILQENQGVSAARNNGVKASEGRYLAFLDADDAWLPTKIQKQVDALNNSQNPGLVHVGVAEIDADGKVIRERLDGLEGDVQKELLLIERSVILGGGSGSMITRQVFNEVSGFDEGLSTSADWDMFVRICGLHEAVFVPEVLLKYRIHLSNMHGNLAAMEHDMLRGLEKAFSSNASAPRSRCYGNLHKVLAASNFYAGNMTASMRHAIKSISYRPSNTAYFLSAPFRNHE